MITKRDPARKGKLVARNIIALLLLIVVIFAGVTIYNQKATKTSTLTISDKKVLEIKYNNKFEVSAFYDHQVGDKNVDGSIYTRKKCFQFPNPDCQYNSVVSIDLYRSSNPYFVANKKEFELKHKYMLTDTQIGNYKGYFYEETANKIGVIFADGYMVTLQWLNPVPRSCGH